MSNKPVFWKQANGKLVSVDEMDINHLRNVLKLIITNSQKAQIKDSTEKKAYWDKQNKKVFLNGDMANEFNDSYPEDEEDLGYRFNDDECRGNQWN